MVRAGTGRGLNLGQPGPELGICLGAGSLCKSLYLEILQIATEIYKVPNNVLTTTIILPNNQIS